MLGQVLKSSSKELELDLAVRTSPFCADVATAPGQATDRFLSDCRESPMMGEDYGQE